MTIFGDRLMKSLTADFLLYVAWGTSGTSAHYITETNSRLCLHRLGSVWSACLPRLSVWRTSAHPWLLMLHLSGLWGKQLLLDLWSCRLSLVSEASVAASRIDLGSALLWMSWSLIGSELSVGSQGLRSVIDVYTCTLRTPHCRHVNISP